MNPSFRPRAVARFTLKVVVFTAVAVLLALAGAARAATPADFLAAYTAEAGAPADAARGQKFFLAQHGQAWSCASCHGSTPTGSGKHATTAKTIAPLAPAFNAERFTDAAKVDKWFRRNCKDVLARECSPAEKADVMAWLVSLKR
jgi:cytochrome c553